MLSLCIFSPTCAPLQVSSVQQAGGLIRLIFLYTAAIKELVAAYKQLFLFVMFLQCMPKVVSSDHYNCVWQEFLGVCTFHSKSWRIHPKNTHHKLLLWPQAQALKYHEMTISNSIKQLSAVKQLEISGVLGWRWLLK